MSGKVVVMRFLMEHGAFMNVVVNEAKAKQTVEHWLLGKLGQGRLGDSECPMPWSVDLAKVIAIHCIPPEQVFGQAQQAPQGQAHQSVAPRGPHFGSFAKGTSGVQ